MHSIYIHVPFCLKKCPYCDFYSRSGAHTLYGTYLQALEKEMISLRERIDRDRLRTLYIGGGTPTVLENQQLDQLLTLCRNYLLPLSFSRSWQGEFTVEVNPGTINQDKGRILSQGGVNRVSLGAQSLDDRLLNIIGRIHKASDVIDAVKIIRNSGLRNLNIDLIFALPGQSVQQWKTDLAKGIDLNPEHFSIYNLTLASGTPFYHNPPPLPAEDDQILMMELAREKLLSAGYQHYEISNYARQGRRSSHNMVYWKGGEYLGLGPGAHSYYNGVRSSNVNSVEQYIGRISSNTSPVAFSEIINAKTKASEALMLGLRLRDGISEEAFRERFGPSWKEKVASFLEAGFLEHDSGQVRLTHRGMLVSDEVLARLI